MPTLLYQLAAMWGPYRKLMAQILRDDPQLTLDSTSRLFSRLLLKPLKSLEKQHPPGPLVLVIDALDECGEPGTRRSLLNALFEASCRAPWLKVIITSREEYDIRSFFQQSNSSHYLSRDLAADDQECKDIRIFAEKRMASIAADRHLPCDWPGKERLDQMVAHSGGLFIFVQTVWRYVRKFKDPEEPLTRVLSGMSGKANTELDELYTIAIGRHLGDERETFRTLAGAIIAVAPYRLLGDESLAVLTGLETRVVTSWIDDLSSLLYRDGTENGGIRVRHLSILDFLTGTSCSNEFRVDLRQANMNIALSCLRIMIRELKFNICHLKTSHLKNTDVNDLDARVARYIPAHLSYACQFWASHAQEMLFEPTILEIVRVFLHGKFLQWLEVLSLTGKLSSASSSLKLCIKGIKVTLHDWYPN